MLPCSMGNVPRRSASQYLNQVFVQKSDRPQGATQKQRSGHLLFIHPGDGALAVCQIRLGQVL